MFDLKHLKQQSGLPAEVLSRSSEPSKQIIPTTI